MATWKLHWLDATGDLSPWQQRITADLETAQKTMRKYVRLPALDILVERGDEAVRKDIGLGAHVTRPNLVTLILDPYNEQFGDTLSTGLIQRQMVNCAHRALRAAGPGYGFTLGGALVSEGLAAQFTRLVFGGPLEHWETMSEHVLTAHWPDQRTMMSTKYDHSEWFHGNGNKPSGYGYALGARLAEYWLLSGVSLDPQRLINVPTPKVLGAAPVRAMTA
ncbi:MAG: DUF2268 domain-containing putative Zn-dependent protease [Pseudomonadota bacterium]